MNQAKKRALRTGAEPLSASWAPLEEHPRGHSGKGHGLVYALPILVVLTALAVFKVAAVPVDPVVKGVVLPGSEVLAENPPKSVDLTISTADLPGGGGFTVSGEGSLRGERKFRGEGGGDAVGSPELDVGREEGVAARRRELSESEFPGQPHDAGHGAPR